VPTVSVKEIVVSSLGAKFGLAALLFLPLIPLTLAEDVKKEDATPEDKQVVDSKVVRGKPATSVKFRKELNLPYSSLNTLGPRIDAARRASDPVTLAHAANELAVAERVSGKKASLTSSQLIRESAELAKLRRQQKELEAVQRVSEQIAGEDDTIALIRKEIALAQAEATRDTEAYKQNLEPTWKPRKVIVNNYTTEYLAITVNGNYKMEVEPGMTKICIIEHRWNPVVLWAYGNEDIDKWGPREIWGRFNTYTWNIN
jgi:hypothetical protein